MKQEKKRKEQREGKSKRGQRGEIDRQKERERESVCVCGWVDVNRMQNETDIRVNNNIIFAV